MKTFDIITVAPNTHDFPMYRNNIRKFAKYATNINYVISCNTHEKHTNEWYDVYLDTIKKDIPFCNFVKADYSESSHWYDCAMKLGVSQCKSEYVLFLEPDLDIDADQLFNNTSTFNYDVVTIPTKPLEGHRLWPAFFMTRLDLIKKTRLDFSEGTNNVWNMAIYDETKHSIQLIRDQVDNLWVDNFDKFTNDIMEQTKNIVFTNMLGVNHYNYTHICWNWNWCRIGEYDRLHKPQRFGQYLKKSLEYNVLLHEKYIVECHKYIDIITTKCGLDGDLSDGR